MKTLRFKTFYSLFLEGISPKDKIRKYKIDDPFMIQFILRYGDEIEWKDIKTSEDIENEISKNLLPNILKRLRDKNHPKTVLYSGDNIDVDKEVNLVRQAHPEHYENIIRIRKEKGDDAIKEYITDIINRDKNSVLWIWWSRINENLKNPVQKYLTLKPIFDSTDSSKKKTPKPYIWSAVRNFLKSIESNPYDLRSLTKIYELTLSEQLSNVERFKRIPTGDLIWIKIPGKREDPKNFDSNVETLMGLSCNIWCISGKTMANTYLSGDGSFYLLLDIKNKKPTALMAVRMRGDKVEEIRGELEEQRFDPVEMEQGLLDLTKEENLDQYQVWEWINEERKNRKLEVKIPKEIQDFKNTVKENILEILIAKENLEDRNQLTFDFFQANEMYEQLEYFADQILDILTFSEKRPEMGILIGDLNDVKEEFDDDGISSYLRTVDYGSDISVYDTDVSEDQGNEIMLTRYDLNNVVEEIKSNIDFSDESNTEIVQIINDLLESGAYSNEQPYSFLSALNEAIDLKDIDYDIERMYEFVVYAYQDGIRIGIVDKIYSDLLDHLKDNFSIISGKYLDEFIFSVPVDIEDLKNIITFNSNDEILDILKDTLLDTFKEDYSEFDTDSAHNNYDFDLESAKESYRNN
jgi:hypothetical protein